MTSVDKKVLQDLIGEARTGMLQTYSDRTGFSIGLGRITQDLDKKFLDDNYYESIPLLIQDKEGYVWVYGLEADGDTSKLTALNKKYASELTFKTLLEPPNYPEYLAPNSIPDVVYQDIGMVHGHSKEYHYTHLPKGIDEKQRTAIMNRMQKFIESASFDKFVAEFLEVVQGFSQADLDSLGQSTATENAVKLIRLWQVLKENGFSDAKGENINFWSGEEGQYRAKTTPGETSSSDIPTLSVMFDLIGNFSDANIKISNRISEGLSKMFALQANTRVNVYISSNKETEESALTAGNNFWNAELFTLQEKLRKGEIESIQIHLYNAETGKWEAPVNINSKEADVILFLVRRNSYQPTLPAHMKEIEKEIKECGDMVKRFSDGRHAYSNFMEWSKKSEPRPAIPLGTLRRVLHHWKAQTDKKIVERSKTSVKDSKQEKTLVSDKDKMAAVQKRMQQYILYKWKGTKPPEKDTTKPRHKGSLKKQ